MPQQDTAWLFFVNRHGETELVRPCCRCGFCCLSEPCPAGREKYRPAAGAVCPGLSWDPDGLAACALYQETGDARRLGIGAGCCLKARAINQKTSLQIPWATLPAETRRQVAADFRRDLEKHQQAEVLITHQ